MHSLFCYSQKVYAFISKHEGTQGTSGTIAPKQGTLGSLHEHHFQLTHCLIS